MRGSSRSTRTGYVEHLRSFYERHRGRSGYYLSAPARSRLYSSAGNPPQPQLSTSTSSIMTNVDSSGLLRTSSNSRLAPSISADFSSAVIEVAPGFVPSRITWMVTIGITGYSSIELAQTYLGRLPQCRGVNG